MSTKITGQEGEDLACQFLQKAGYQIIARNFLIRGGEIDIVAKNGETLVFVEVKTRFSHQFGLPSEAITPLKLKHLLKTALFYLERIKWGDRPFRLDFVSVDYSNSKDHPQIELIKNITD